MEIVDAPDRLCVVGDDQISLQEAGALRGLLSSTAATRMALSFGRPW